MELSDSWLREYQVILNQSYFMLLVNLLNLIQVLPERTHPKVMMDCCSGYLLTGITVANQT